MTLIDAEVGNFVDNWVKGQIALPMPDRIDCPKEDAPVQYLAVCIPCYTNVPTQFLANMIPIFRLYPGIIDIAVTRGVYVVEAMRQVIKKLEDRGDWQRLLVVEQDMILPPETFKQHGQHDADIVGSVYFQHHLPHRVNCLFRDPVSDKIGFPEPRMVQHMLDNPGLWNCSSVGFGCTSISKRVFQNWDSSVPMFRTEKDESNEVGHDLWFCSKAIEQGFKVWLDTSILCGHLTEEEIGVRHFQAANYKELNDG